MCISEDIDWKLPLETGEEGVGMRQSFYSLVYLGLMSIGNGHERKRKGLGSSKSE